MCVCGGRGQGTRTRTRKLYFTRIVVYKTRQDYFIVRPPAHYNRSEHSGNSNSHGSNDGLKLSFLVLKALKTKVDNFSMVGAFVLPNNKGNLNMDGCLPYFGGIRSSLKAVYFGHTNKNKNKNVLLFLVYYRMDNLYPCRGEQFTECP